MNEIFKGMDNAAEQINENFQGLLFDSGSNEDGNWVRLPDGTQICYGVFSLSSGGLSYRLERQKTFPKSFESVPAVTMNTPWLVTGGTAEASVIPKATSVTNDRFSATVIRSSGTFEGTYAGISYIAIGRWK